MSNSFQTNFYLRIIWLTQLDCGKKMKFLHSFLRVYILLVIYSRRAWKRWKVYHYFGSLVYNGFVSGIWISRNFATAELESYRVLSLWPRRMTALASRRAGGFYTHGGLYPILDISNMCHWGGLHITVDILCIWSTFNT